MEKVSVEYLRQTQIRLLNAFDTVCKQNKINYFLSNGTLLGAVKYKGFIPWDDDVDVCMPRRDYNRLIEVMKAMEGNKDYTFFAHEIDDAYLFPFAKMSDRGTLLEEKGVDNGVALGINIDIFPIDGFGSSVTQARRIYRKMEKLRRGLNWAKRKCDFPLGTVKSWVKLILILLHRMVGAKEYVRRIIQYAQRFDYEESTLVGNSIWGFYGEGEYHEKRVFEESKPLEFEGRAYPGPAGYHDYLTRLYGNYVADPPIEKQVTHHSFEVTIL